MGIAYHLFNTLDRRQTVYGIRESFKKIKGTTSIFSRRCCKNFRYFSQSVSKWELGKGYPDLDNLIKLSDLYGVSLDEIIRGEVKYSGKVEDSQQSELSHKTFGDFMYHYWWLIFPILGMLSPIIYRLIW